MRPNLSGRSFGVLAVAGGALLLAAVALSPCGGVKDGPSGGDADARIASRPGRANYVWLAAARRGQAAIGRLTRDVADREAYLELRRDALESMYVWRRSISMAAVGAFGPEIVYDEAPGALGALDAAIAARDGAAAAKPLVQLRDSFSVARLEIEGRGVPDAQAGQALSDAAFALGQAIAESTTFVPEAHDSALADAQGLLDAMDLGAQALEWDLGDALGPFLALRRAHDFAGVPGRAALVRATGALGNRIRDAAAERGIVLSAPYAAQDGSSEISALTLPRPGLRPTAAQAALGARLFGDPRLSGSGGRSCATCHIPKRAFTDGRATPTSLDPRQPLARNTPTLLFAPLEARLMWDGRLRRADEQALGVIHARSEMGQTDAALGALIAGAMGDAFNAAFGHSASVSDVGAALATYEASALVPEDARIDQFARGELRELSEEEARGFDVFVGTGRCARCHVPPVFAGSRPPDFTAPIFGVLGVPRDVRGTALDLDPGRFVATHRAQDRGAFRSPTVRDVAWTAPFFHNGVFATVEEVVDFYDRGGGRALGFEIPFQDPDVRPLHLTVGDKKALFAFLVRSLSNEAVPTNPAPVPLP